LGCKKKTERSRGTLRHLEAVRNGSLSSLTTTEQHTRTKKKVPGSNFHFRKCFYDPPHTKSLEQKIGKKETEDEIYLLTCFAFKKRKKIQFPMDGGAVRGAFTFKGGFYYYYFNNLLCRTLK
jgi:hypothetical protein